MSEMRKQNGTVAGPATASADTEATDLLETVTIRTCPNPIFVIGSPRSGTSVLPWSLAHHWDFWTSNETEFIHAFFKNAGPIFEGLKKREGTFIAEQDIDRQEFFKTLGIGINALLSSRSGGKRWIDQSPGYTTMAWYLAEMFPGAQFIHVLRDGRAVVNSMIHFGDRANKKAPDGSELQSWATDFTAAVQTWRHYVEFALDFCERRSERTLTVKNEDLVGRTEEEFDRIFDFLGARHNRQPAQFFRRSRVNSSFGPLVWGTGDQINEPIPTIPRATAEDAWQSWSDEQRRIFSEIAGDLLQRMGYPLLDA